MAAPPAGPPTVTPPLVVTSSTQTIWQVQVTGCLVQCQGLAQLQDAGQQNTTLQADPGGVLPGLVGVSSPSLPSLPSPSGAGAPSGPAALSQVTSTITQIQAGCQLECFGTATVSSPLSESTVAQLISGLSAVQQLLSSPATLRQLLSGPAGLQQLLSGPGASRLLTGLDPGQLLLAGLALLQPAAPSAVPGADKNLVDQTAYQAQSGGPGTPGQVQTAIQVNATIQSPTSPAWAVTGAQSGAESSAGAAVNQAAQGIWQLQIGCIFYCTGTQQTQQASQSDTLTSVTDVGSGPVAAVVNSAVTGIWQLQIGCLFWCYDTVELQSAVASVSAATVYVDVTPAVAPSAATGADNAGAGASPGMAAEAPVPATATPPPTVMSPPPASPALASASGEANGISSPPEFPVQISSTAWSPVRGAVPALVRVFTVAPVPVGGAASRRSRGASGTIVAGRVGARIGASGSPANHNRVRENSAGFAKRRTLGRAVTAAPKVTVVSQLTARPSFVAAGSIASSPLLAALGAAVVLFLVGVLVAGVRRTRAGI